MSKEIDFQHETFLFYENAKIEDGIIPHSTVDYFINGQIFYQRFYDNFDFSFNDILGYVFLVFGFFIFLLNIKKFENGYLWILFSLILHQIVIFINAYGVLLQGQANDALYYVYGSLIYLNNENVTLTKILTNNFFQGDIYNKITSTLNLLNGESKFTLMQLNYVFFIISIVYLFKISKIYKLTLKNELILLLILPSVIFYTSASLKESISMLSVTILVYYLSKIKNKFNLIILIKIIISIFFFCETQKGHSLIIATFGFLLIILNYKKFYITFNIKKSLFTNLTILFSITFITIILLSQMKYTRDINFVTLNPFNLIDSFFSALKSYRSISNPEHYTYLHFNNLEPKNLNFIEEVYLFLLIFVNYIIFIPLQNFNIKGLVLFYESIFRVTSIIGFLIAYYNFKINFKLIFIFLILYNFIYSLGTFNFGTALRHHVPLFPLYLIGFSYTILYLSQKFRKYE